MKVLKMSRLSLQSCRLLARKCSRTSYLPHRGIVSSSFRLQQQEKLEGASSSKSDNSESMIKSVEDTHKNINLSSIDQHRQPMAPFMKEMFCGRYEPLVLSYPDVLNNDRYFNLEKRIVGIKESLEERLDLLDLIDEESRISKDLLLTLRSQGFFGLRGPIADGGENFSVTESLRLLEEVAHANLSLSNYVVNNSWLGIPVIERFASDRVKKELMPRLHSGQALVSLCVNDEGAGSDANSTSVIAKYDENDETFLITGKKNWVTSAPDADYMIVWANVIGRTPDGDAGSIADQCLTGFLVDVKNTPGIKIHKEQRYKTNGLRGLEICPVSFTNTPVKYDYQIGTLGDGFQTFVNGVGDEGRLANATQVLAALRKLLTVTLRHSMDRQAYGTSLNDFDLVSHRIGKCCQQLFALESTIYMTAGLADYQQDPDIFLEATACRLLAIKTARMFKESCGQILGCQTYEVNSHFSQLFHDLEGLEWWESTEDLSALYIGLAGFAYSGEGYQEIVGKQRNPGLFILDNIKYKFEERFNIVKQPRLKYKIYEDVHPSLNDEARKFERLLHLFGFTVKQAMINYGYNVHTHEIDVARLAEVAVKLYAMTSVIGRANRTYCDGHPEAVHNLEVASSYVYHTEKEVDQAITEAFMPEYMKYDPYIKSHNRDMKDKGGYCAVHPLTKNLF